MPEGPEIRRAASRIAKVLETKVIDDAFFAQPHLHNSANAIVGERVVNVTSFGKAIVTSFGNGLHLYSHNQLYGRWYVARRGSLPRTNRSLRVALHTDSHSALLYSASEIELLDEAGLAAHAYLAKLGPDALDAAVVWRDIAARLQDRRFRRRSLAALFLDQGFVAGIGNYLRSEILHAVGLHQSLRPTDLTRAQTGQLARATLEITRLAYQTAGVTNSKRRVAALQKQGKSRSEYRFMVFGRENRACYQCGNPIVRIEANSRRLYLCERCQPAAEPPARP
jgi:endonuclease-8